MKKKKNKGGAGDGLFFDSKTKTWGFRAVRDGKDYRYKGFKNKTEAKEARVKFLAEYKDKTKEESKDGMTIDNVFNHFLSYGAYDRRPGTIKKHKSVYKNHIQAVFGSRYVNEITPGDINNFLKQAYLEGTLYNEFKGGYAYKYVEGFLKFFYLIFVYARTMHWLTKEQFEELTVDETTRVTMPKPEGEDKEEEEIVTFSRDEISRMRERIKDSNLYLAFEMGYYCGLRISECFGMMWDDIDWDAHILYVKRQLIYDKPNWVLGPVKTLTADRKIDIPDVLYDLLKEHKEKQEKNKAYYGTAYKATETVRVRMGKGQDDLLTAGNFIHRKEDGQLLTTNSMKSWALKFEKELNIHFKYHWLRHTHASILAALNTPLFKLMERLGHKKIETTQRYYLGKNETADELMLKHLKAL